MTTKSYGRTFPINPVAFGDPEAAQRSHDRRQMRRLTRTILGGLALTAAAIPSAEAASGLFFSHQEAAATTKSAPDRFTDGAKQTISLTFRSHFDKNRNPNDPTSFSDAATRMENQAGVYDLNKIRNLSDKFERDFEAQHQGRTQPLDGDTLTEPADVATQ
jgi:hypothetical protein